MKWYQSFTHFADGTWDIEFHAQGTQDAFIVRLYYSQLPEWGWILI